MKISTCFGIRRESASYTRETGVGAGMGPGGVAGVRVVGASQPAAAHMNVSHFIFMARNLQLAKGKVTKATKEAQK